MADTAEKTGVGESQSDNGTVGGTPERHRQVLTGTVVSDKMDKTVVVAVEKTVMHRLYHRYMKRTSKFTAHDERNEARTGDRVTIVASRPISKRKRWRLREVVERAK